MSTDESLKWRAIRNFDLYWRYWGDEALVYSEGSGNTHLLGLMEAEVLKSLQGKPVNLQQLADCVASSMSLEPDDELVSFLGKLLPQLERLDLIERLE